MITEDYISFETAKLLKERRFDEPCWSYYCDLEICHYFRLIQNITNPCAFGPAAPTLQMAVKWIQEIYNIIIVADYDYECTDTSWFFKVYRLGDNGKPEKVPVKGVTYDDSGEHEHIVGYRDYERSYKDYATRIEALEDGIKYVLKKLI